MPFPQPPPPKRLPHALRTALGGSIIAVVALLTPLTSGCISAAVFFICTVAGTPSNFQGPQLRSTSLTIVGALIGLIFYALVRVITYEPIPTFFLALPILLVFSALRADKALMPLPAVSIVIFGFMVIANANSDSSNLPSELASFALDICLAWIVAIVVTLPFPQRAGDLGRQIVSAVLSEMGSAISKVASRTFASQPVAEKLEEHHLSLFVEDYGFTEHPRQKELVYNAREYLRFMGGLSPSGETRFDEYEALAKAVLLFDGSRYEPRILPEASARWRNAAAWMLVVQDVRTIVDKVASLESVIGLGGVHFSRVREFFGDAYLPMWKVHLASCAAACDKLGAIMREATCSNVCVYFDTERWARRRVDMYFGFLVRYRLGLRAYASVLDSRGLEEKEGGGESARVVDLRSLREKCQVDELRQLCRKDATEKSERQMLSFFAITAQALSEEIAHVQQSMQELAKTSDARGLLAPLYFFVSALPDLWKRIKLMATGGMSSWEVQFAFTHAMLLASIMALSLFLPVLENYEANEIAWVFTSAALATQLSAEPTLFIGSIRVVATIMGTFLSFGFSKVLDLLGRESKPAIQFALVPYIFFVTMACLLLIPLQYRYAAFLVIVTNSIMLFCPRSTPNCSVVLAQQTSECFPDWQYGVSRAANVSIGVVFALVFHLVFWPRFANAVALQCFCTAYLNGSRVFGKLHRKYFRFGTRVYKATHSSIEDGKAALSPEFGLTNSVLAGDVYQKEETALEEIREMVGKPLSSAMLTAKSEASVWLRGPFKVNPIIPDVLPHFVALEVCLLEMAAILGRRPIFSKSYGRSVFEHYISPMLHVYVTAQMSLHNLAGIVLRCISEKRSTGFQENITDLRLAVNHLARVRGDLRRDVDKRTHEFKKYSALALAQRKTSRFSPSAESADDSFAGMILDDIGSPDVPARKDHRRSLSSGDASGKEVNSGPGLSVDDVVVFDAFSFISDGCLSAFIRIAKTVLFETESRQEKSRKKRR